MVILVVDDYAETRQVLKVLLEMDGHTVHEAQNGLEAVNVAMRVLPELILLDLNMPVMDGFTTARVLREQASTSTIRIVAISADGRDSESKTRALRSGCDEVYAKPLEFESLQGILMRSRA